MYAEIVAKKQEIRQTEREKAMEKMGVRMTMQGTDMNYINRSCG